MRTLPLISLAPMEGVVDYVIRDLLTNMGGIDHCVTEFVRITDKKLPTHVFEKYCPELRQQGKTKAGTPCFVQLLGGQPEPLAENALVAFQLGALGIDLNFGCPAKTVNRHDGGATLLKKPERLFQIISTVKKALPDGYPVTAKVRLGFEDKSRVKEISLAVSEANAHWLTIHARTKLEGYKPPAHWEFIALMKEVSKIPIIANGDIWTVEDYLRCREISGCKHVALGRPLIARPDLGLAIYAAIENKTYTLKDWNYYQKHFLPAFFKSSLEYKTEKYTLARVKQYTKMMSREFNEAHEFFESIKRKQCVEEMASDFS